MAACEEQRRLPLGGALGLSQDFHLLCPRPVALSLCHTNEGKS